MVDRYKAGPHAALEINDAVRKRWEAFGLTSEAAQREVFHHMARAVAELTIDDSDDWLPASDLLEHGCRPPKEQ